MADQIHIFRLYTGHWDGAKRLQELRKRLPQFGASFWKPSLGSPFPPGRRDPRILAYTFMHLAGAFRSSEYGMVSILDGANKIAHSSMIMPSFSRFPFMGEFDLQIGATFTSPDNRGQGLAVWAIDETVSKYHGKELAFWYLTAASNLASISVIKKAGFVLTGIGAKQPRLGVKALGYYDILE